MKKLFILISLCLLCSCSAHLYPTSNYNISQTQVVLDKANFKVIGTAEGSAQANYLLGIGGLSQKSLKGNAIADMYKSAKLTNSQAIINVTFKQRVTGVIIWSQIEYTASGTIIEFIDDERPITSSNTTEYQCDHTKSHVTKSVDTTKEFIVSKNEHNGTWQDAIEYCKKLGQGWRLPNIEQAKYICDNYDIEFSKCWTNVEVDDRKAIVYHRGYAFPNVKEFKSINNISIIAIKAADNKDVE